MVGKQKPNIVLRKSWQQGLYPRTSKRSVPSGSAGAGRAGREALLREAPHQNRAFATEANEARCHLRLPNDAEARVPAVSAARQPRVAEVGTQSAAGRGEEVDQGERKR